MLRSLKILFLIHLFFLPLTCLAGSPGPTRQELLQRRDSIKRSRLTAIQKGIDKEKGTGPSHLMPVFIMIIILSPVLFVQCNFGRNNQDGESHDVQSRNEDLMGVSDSILRTVPIIPDLFFSDEKNIIAIKGVELSSDIVEDLLKMDIGIVFPRGIKISPYDIKTIYAPRFKMSIIGRWELLEGIDSFLLKCEDIKEKGIFICLMTVRESVIKDACDIAITQNDSALYGDQDLKGPTLAEKKNNDVIIYSFNAHNERQDIRKIWLAQDGIICAS
ncbi:MAG: hypothetical protein IJM41_00605 [Bacteroidales bacterium]|nr:hypothetical protein [Bacteroidales bacterium]